MIERLIGHGWGSIDLDINGDGFRLAEAVDATITVNAKRQMGPCRLRAMLVCQARASRVVPTRLSRRGATVNRQASSQEIWRTEVQVDNELVFQPGETFSFPIAVHLPPADPSVDAAQLPEWARGAIAVVNTLTFSQQRIVWQLRAQLDHPDGFSLRRHLPISVIA